MGLGWRAARRLAEDGQYGVDAERRLRAKRRRTGSGAVEEGRSDNDTNSDASDDDAQQSSAQSASSSHSVLLNTRLQESVQSIHHNRH